MFPLEAINFSQLLSTNNLIIYLIMSVAVAVILLFSAQKFLLSLQQGGYQGRRYFKWLFSPQTAYLTRLTLLSMLGFLFFCILSTCFAPICGETASSYIGFISFFLFVAVYINTERQVNKKVPLKITKRMIRLCVTYFIVIVAFTFGSIILLNYLAFVINIQVVAILRYSLICLIPILMPLLLIVAYGINEPFEEIIRIKIQRNATLKLQNSNVLKIAITGSYGKTSVKEILKTLLSQKYRVLATPSSYNTPLGIALTLKDLDNTHDIFIAEMGARYKGDIKQLTEIVKPSVGILTGINNQHLESFGSIENIKKTKFELFEGLANGGKGFFSLESEGAKELFEKFDGEKYAVNQQDTLVYATDIERDSNGISFTLNIKGEQPIKCNTILLGTHSVKNICLASAVAYNIGLGVEDIQMGISRLKAVGHRLELVPNNKEIVLIDDSYNSNEDGIKAAMEVLDSFTGRKIVLTPGLVELGKMENIANYNFGKTLAQHADKVIVIGSHNAEMIISGLLDGNMQRENISFCKTLSKGNELLSTILQKGDVVLFENDLPDNYS